MRSIGIFSLIFTLTVPIFVALACRSTGESDPQASLQGVELWTQNCNRCHNFRPATQFSDREWETIMTHMQVRANLTATEAQKIKEFLKLTNGE